MLRSEDEIKRSWQAEGVHPKLSICCATHNHERYVGEALDAFLSQRTDFSFEIIVHDDASTDGTLGLLRSYQKRYPTLINVIAQSENQFSRGRRIYGEFLLPAARGEYIAICEGDDYWTDPQKLAKQVAFLEDNREYVVCYSDCVGMDDKTGKLQQVRGVRWDLSSRQLQETAPIFTLTACFRNVIRVWPSELSNAPYGDMAIWSLLGDHGKGKYARNIAASRYRLHPGGVHSMQSQSRRLRMSIETLMALCAYRLKRGENSLAKAHLENIVVLALRMYGVSLLTGIAGRALNHVATRLSHRRKNARSR